MRPIVVASALGVALALAGCLDAADDAATAPADAPATADTAAPAAAAMTRLDPNTATAEELAAVSGSSSALAAAIVAGRPYASVTDLYAKLHDTLDDAAAAKVLETVFVPINLNSATEGEIKLVPGMSRRMVHEFMEYRPYADMAEFDREIGKYVDAAELARLRSYVTL